MTEDPAPVRPSTVGLSTVGLSIDLGPARDRPQPESIQIGRDRYFIAGSRDEPRVFADVCPHMGGRVVVDDGEFVCPLHRWKFSFDTGRCTTSPGQSLREFPASVVEDRVVADLPNRSPSPKSRLQHDCDSKRSELVGQPIEIALRSHACLEIRANETANFEPFELLTDPWLSGPAFLGSWIPYPYVPVDPKALHPDAIWISHEHSDHFHEPTLAQMDRTIPVYVPDFPNRRMPDRLHLLGFEKVTALPFGMPHEIAPDVRITVYEPESLWNDAILLVETRGVRLLNLNDAGLNARIAERVGPVDVVASAFTPGASSYPLAWTHVSDNEKREILLRSKKAMLEMLHRAADLYGASTVLPFAGHFALVDELHESYLQKFQKNSVDDVVASFASSDVTVLDLLPGERFNAVTGEYQRIWQRRERLGQTERMLAHVRRERRKLEPVEVVDPLTSDEVIEKLLAFNRTLEMRSCEDVSVRLEWKRDEGSQQSLDFAVRDRVLAAPSPSSPKTDSMADSRVDLVIELPERVLAAIVRDDASWDEAHIGYWCTLSRDPDVYHAGFWRMLQAPRTLSGIVSRDAGRETEPRPVVRTSQDSTDHPLRSRSVRAIIDDLGEPAIRVLHRAGLYCLACERAEADRLEDAARCHGLGDAELSRMERELEALSEARSAIA